MRRWESKLTCCFCFVFLQPTCSAQPQQPNSDRSDMCVSVEGDCDSFEDQEQRAPELQVCIPLYNYVY